MVYSFALIKHANIRFRESVRRLGRYELAAMLHALGIDCDVVPEESGGADFLTFVCRPLSVAEIGYLSRHSSVSFMASKENGLLRPLDGYRPGYLPEDLPEVLKYKGKTSVPFTRMILNMALSLTGFVHASGPLTVMDPLCGKGTACFCAMMEGMNAVGLDDSFRELSPFELSGGNIRRCALAGILAMRPRFLVLDEPTAGLDPAGRFQILQMVAAMNREGTGIIMVTHNMDDAAAYADRIIVMDRGAVAMDDTPSGIFTRTDEIVALGLDVPFCVKLGAALRSKGIVFPAQIVREGEAAAYLTDLMSGKGGAARA